MVDNCVAKSTTIFTGSYIFEKVVQQWNRDLMKGKKKIFNTGMKVISLVFFPSNKIAVLQPVDQEIIQVFKRIFRKNLVFRRIDCLDCNHDSSAAKIIVKFR